LIKQSPNSKHTYNKQLLANLWLTSVLGGVGGTMSRAFTVTWIILIVFINNAQAIECQTSVQGGDSHWAWRLIDGRKCWYKGASGMDKSLLHWPAAEDSPDTPENMPDKPKVERTQAIPEMQPIPPGILNMLPIMPPQATFDDRWRLH
jgi:hypothetical protein